MWLEGAIKAANSEGHSGELAATFELWNCAVADLDAISSLPIPVAFASGDRLTEIRFVSGTDIMSEYH
jgi:hypothetical protein